MKTKRFFQLGLAVAATALLAACSDPGKPSSGESGSAEDVTISRTEIYPDQPTTFSSVYTPANKDNIQDVKVYIKFFQGGEEAKLKDFPIPQSDGNVVFMRINTFDPGTYEVKFTFDEIFKDKSNKSFEKKATFTVKEGPTDMRNSMWNSDKKTCKQDISYTFYYAKDVTETADAINFTEDTPDVHKDTFNAKQVAYLFAQDKLTQMTYTIQAKAKPIYFINSTMSDVEKLVAYYSFANLKYDAPVATDLTAEEQALVNEFKSGKMSSEKTGTLAKAIQEGRLKLTISGGNARTVFNMEVAQNTQAENPVANYVFTPAK